MQHNRVSVTPEAPLSVVAAFVRIDASVFPSVGEGRHRCLTAILLRNIILMVQINYWNYVASYWPFAGNTLIYYRHQFRSPGRT